MRSNGDAPTVVKIRDDVTGALSVVSVDQVSTVLDVWFPQVTPEARHVILALQDRVEAEDWRRVDELAEALGLRIECLAAPTSLPTPHRSAEDWPGPNE